LACCARRYPGEPSDAAGHAHEASGAHEMDEHELDDRLTPGRGGVTTAIDRWEGSVVTSPVAAARRPPSLLRHPDFLKLWSAETISQAGTQVSFLALPLVAIVILQASAFEVALLGAIEFLPFILFTLPAGVWVDRLRRRPILIAGDIVRAASLISIPIAYALGGLSIYQLYIVGFINGVATVFFDVAYQSYLPALVDREQLVEGNSKLEVSRSGAAILGPGIAGVLIGAITAPIAVIVDSISFVASALFLLLIRRPEPLPVSQGGDHGRQRGSMRQETMEGLRYVIGHPHLRAIAACTSTSNLVGNFANAILIVYLVRQLGLAPEQIGVVFSVGAIGFLLGALIGSRISTRFGVGRTIIGSAVIFAPGNLMIALAPASIAAPVVVAATFIGGFAGVVYNITQVSLRQAITPERMQGRMNATMRFLVWGTIPVGSVIGGVLGSTIGLRETILVSGVLGFVPFLFVLFSPVRTLLTMPEPAERTPSRVDSPAEDTSEALDETSAPLGIGPLGRPDAN
jgi:MFS family permease